VDVSQFVGNPDAFAQQQKDGTYLPVRSPLTPVELDQHVAGQRTIGTYVLHYDKARFFVFDIDDQDLGAARQLSQVCADLGYTAGIEFSGKKGYHVWVLLDQWYPAVDIQRLAAHIASTVGFNGEVFPKQAVARDLGNLIKLPLGRHQVTGVMSRFLTEPHQAPAGVFTQSLAGVPAPALRSSSSSNERPCLSSIQNDPPGEGERNHCMYQFIALMRRAGLEGTALEELAFVMNARFQPPLDSAAVDSILATTEDHYGPICDQLRPERRCGEQCVMQKWRGLNEGLHVRPGDVRHAAKGDTIVVRLGDQVPGSNSVYIEHPDVDKGIVQYRRGERP
jgi:hypothetical protein